MRTIAQVFVMALAATLLALSALAQAAPPPPPPHPSKISPPVDICAERYSIRAEFNPLFQLRPCTIVVGPKGRRLELASTTGPGPFRHANGKQHRPTRVVFRAFVPVAREPGGRVLILQTGRVLRVRLPNRLPSVIDPYVVTLPRGICREDGWLVSAAVSDGTETKPFGVINSMCGPAAPKPEAGEGGPNARRRR